MRPEHCGAYRASTSARVGIKVPQLASGNQLQVLRDADEEVARIRLLEVEPIVERGFHVPVGYNQTPKGRVLTHGEIELEAAVVAFKRLHLRPVPFLGRAVPRIIHESISSCANRH